jgi:hypothetical protein
MPKRLSIPIFAALAILLVTVPAHGERVQEGNLLITFDGDFSPHALPRDRPAPISVHVEGAIGTTDESHPPPVRRVEIALNRNGRLTTAGLPSCPSARLQSTSSDTALDRCRPALVGRGSFGAEVEFPGVEPFPATGRALAFFGTRKGSPALLIHLYVTAPIQTTLVIALKISRREEGQFGNVLTARVPSLAGGLGSVTKIDLTIGRTYRHRGERRSFLSASCAAPAGFTGGIFPLARGSFHFADGRTIRTTLVRNCRVR